MDLDSTPIDDSTVVDLFQMFQHKRFRTLIIRISECNITCRSYELCFLLVSSLNSKYLETLQ